ncbi:MAG: hypothetical protein AAF334_02805 [Pseudomonadota bacterium]
MTKLINYKLRARIVCRKRDLNCELDHCVNDWVNHRVNHWVNHGFNQGGNLDR